MHASEVADIVEYGILEPLYPLIFPCTFPLILPRVALLKKFFIWYLIRRYIWLCTNITGDSWCHRIFPIQETCILAKKDLQLVVSKLVEDYLGKDQEKLQQHIKVGSLWGLNIFLINLCIFLLCSMNHFTSVFFVSKELRILFINISYTVFYNIMIIVYSKTMFPTIREIARQRNHVGKIINGERIRKDFLV